VPGAGRSRAPEEIYPLYDEALDALEEQGVTEQYRGINGTVAVALDGTWHFSSQKIHCDNCSCIHLRIPDHFGQ
jgi:hypothetical protein